MSTRIGRGSWLLVSSCVAIASCDDSGTGTRSAGEPSSAGTADTSLSSPTLIVGATSHDSTSLEVESTRATETTDSSPLGETPGPNAGDTTNASLTATGGDPSSVDASMRNTGPTSEDTSTDASTSEVTSTGASTSGPDTREVDCGTVVVNAKLGKIPTVGVVTFSADFHIDSASIEFAPMGTDAYTTAPVDLQEQNYKTYLLGMKQSKEYTFRVVINADGKTCTSPEQTITTGVLEPVVELERVGDGVGTRGFFSSTTFSPLGANTAYIFDTDGDLVWAHPGLNTGSRVRMDWEGKNIWSIVAQGGSPAVLRISMDGEEVEEVTALATAHHDFTVLPGGHIVAIANGDPAAETPVCARVLDYDPATKTARTVIANVETLFQPIDGCHTNALTYQAHTNTFIISDRNINAFVKFSAVDGTPIWQLGGVNPIAPQLSGGDQVWERSHGHHLTEDGRFVLFNNTSPNRDYSAIREFQIDEAAGTVTGGDYFLDDAYSSFLGDVQVLKNGNLWVTNTQFGTLSEYNPARELVTRFHVNAGYTYFMESLYEKPYGK